MRQIILLSLFILTLFLFGCSQNTGYECEKENDCITSGKCSAGLECTCSNNKCYAGLVAETPKEECTKNKDCKLKLNCTPPEDPLCFSVPYCSNGNCSCAEGCS